MKRTRFTLRWLGYALTVGAVLGVTVVLAGAGVTTASDAETAVGLHRAYVPGLFNRVDGSLEPPLFGVQMYNNTRDSNKHHPYLLDSGATWLRVNVLWKAIEPTNTSPAAFAWGVADAALAAAHPDMGGLRVIATISDAPDWAAAETNGPLNPANLSDFVTFVAALVERYDGDGLADAPGSPVVLHWEFYNEPDASINSTMPRWGEAGDQYAQMLAAVYPAVKAANPAAQVVFGGIAYDWFIEQNGPFVREFLDDVLTAGGGNYFDIMNFHAYPSFSENWADYGPGLYEKAQVLHARLQQYGLDKPIVVTEAGWHSNNPPNFPGSEEIQAAYVVQLFTQSMAADIDVMIWWMLYDPGGFGWDNGLVTDTTPPQVKQSFTAFQTIVERLNTAHFERVLTDAETGDERVEAYQFYDNIHERRTYVMWLNPVDTQAVHLFEFQGDVVTVFDTVGASYVLRDIDDGRADGRILIPVSSRPIYVEVGS